MNYEEFLQMEIDIVEENKVKDWERENEKDVLN